MRTISRILNYTLALLMSLSAELMGEDYYVTRYAAAVVPHRMLTVPLREIGQVEFCHRGDGRVSKGTLLVKLNAEELALQEAELRNQQRQNKVKAEESLLQLRRKKEELEFIMAQPRERRKFMETRFRTQADSRALALLCEQIAVQEEALRLANEKLQRAFDKEQESRLICMPFDGRVQYHITPGDEDENVLLVTQLGPLLTAVDDSMLYIAVTPEETEIVKLAPNTLHLRLDLGGGEYIRANWHHKKVEQNGRKETLVYYFAVAAQDKERAWSLVGANTIGELFYTPSENEDLLYVRKTELAAEAGTTPYETWEELIAAVRPDFELVFTGETHLCLKKKN